MGCFMHSNLGYIGRSFSIPGVQLLCAVAPGRLLDKHRAGKGKDWVGGVSCITHEHAYVSAPVWSYLPDTIENICLRDEGPRGPHAQQPDLNLPQNRKS